MKVLIVASYNYGKYSPFVSEQAESVKGLNIQIDYHDILQLETSEWTPEIQLKN